MSSPRDTTERKPIQLRWDGPTVVVTPEDEDRFVREASWAVSACQSALAGERFFQQLKSEFLSALHDWCVRHAERVAACYVPFPLAPLQVFVVTRSESYDFELSDPLAELEFELFEKKWPADVNQIPAAGCDELSTFFDPAASIQVYGQPD